MSEDKMKAAFSKWWEESGGGPVSLEVNARHTWKSAWQAALQQEREAVAWRVVTAEGVPLTDWVDGDGSAQQPAFSQGEIQIAYTAPPSAQAIEAAAIMRAAELCEKLRASIIPCDQFESGKQDSAYVLKQRILALIPQDGYTHLQDLMMQGAASAWLEGELCGRGNKPYSADPIVAIVTSLIGEKK